MSGAAEPRAKPGRRSPIRKWAGRLLLVTLSLGLTVFLVDRILTAFNLFGVNYVAETMRCRQELMDLKLHKADGSPVRFSRLDCQLTSSTARSAAPSEADR